MTGGGRPAGGGVKGTGVVRRVVSRVVSGRNNEDRGASLAEYALLVAGIAVMIVAAISVFGDALGTFFSGLSTSLGL